MQIGELARRLATSVATVRYYERLGLLPPPPRTESGRRTYDDDDLRRLAFVRHGRALGFTLEDIRTLLALSGVPSRSCTEIDDMARLQLAAVEAKIHQLQSLRDELRRISAVCSGGAVADCRVMDALVERTLCGGAHEE